MRPFRENPLSYDVQRILLEKINYKFSKNFANCYLQDTELIKSIDEFTNQFIVTLKYSLYGQRSIVEEDTIEETVSYPSNWKESLKERFAPSWFLRKYPVNKITVPVLKKTINRITKVCPHIATKSNQEHLKFFVLD